MSNEREKPMASAIMCKISKATTPHFENKPKYKKNIAYLL